MKAQARTHTQISVVTNVTHLYMELQQQHSPNLIRSYSFRECDLICYYHSIPNI